jgi:archaeosine-15-forming tRNA-guanine transglycosylase
MVLIAVALTTQTAGAVPAAEPTLVAESDEWIAGPISDGRYVVWSSAGSIYVNDLVTGETETVADGDLIIGANTWCTDAAIEDGVLVWSRPTGETNADDLPLYAVSVRDLSTGETREITTAANAQCPVRIDDGRVSFHAEAGTWLYDLSSGGSARPIWTDDEGWFLGLIDDWAIGLQDVETYLDQQFVHKRLLARHLETDETRVLDEGWVLGVYPLLAGVVGDVVAYDTLALTPEAVQYLGGPALSAARLDGSVSPAFYWGRVTGADEYLVASCHNFADTGGTDLWVADLATTSAFTVTLSRESHVTAVLVDGTLVWSEQQEDHYVILTMPWGEALPSARQADPGVVRPEAAYYPETGHTLQLGFKGYWEQHGGLPVFGYPMTEEYDEWNADIDLFRVTQYLERQRFEWHPENEGTPYQVLLGRLGYEHAGRLNLLETEPFRYRGDDEGPDAGCVYFRETGHYACHDFLFYWQEHGLDFGDPGISYRESLALFGYPISEPFTTTNADGDTVVTQYFERAVFELHPDNVYPYRILLRRLGVEALEDRGW